MRQVRPISFQRITGTKTKTQLRSLLVGQSAGVKADKPANDNDRRRRSPRPHRQAGAARSSINTSPEATAMTADQPANAAPGSCRHTAAKATPQQAPCAKASAKRPLRSPQD